MNRNCSRSVTSGRSLLTSLLFAVLALLSDPVAAQSLPELTSASNLSDTPTSARFYAGASVTTGSYSDSFQHSDNIQLELLVPDSTASNGSIGYVYFDVASTTEMRVSYGSTGICPGSFPAEDAIILSMRHRNVLAGDSLLLDGN